MFLCLFLTLTAANNNSTHVVIAGSVSHYPGVLAVVASATQHAAQPDLLEFLLLVDDDPAVLSTAIRCASPVARFVVRRFRLGDWPSKGAALSSKQRLTEPLNYARFFIGELLPASRAVYLDSDVIVRADLRSLHFEALRGFAKDPDAVIAAVPRDFKSVCRVVDCALVEKQGVAITDLHAFNAGVVVFELDRWRQTGMLDAVARWILANQRATIYDLGSNPPLVLAVQRRWVRLDTKWNCMRGLRKQHAHNRRCWDDARIRHYPGDDKPWLLEEEENWSLSCLYSSSSLPVSQ